MRIKSLIDNNVIGGVSIGTNSLGVNSLIQQNVLFPSCVAGVAFNATSNFSEAKCYVDGILQTVASSISAEDFTLQLTYEYLAWPTLQLLYGELAATGGAAVPTSKSAALAATATTITEADITTGNANGASVLAYDGTKNIYLKQALTNTPGVNEYFVDEANSQLIFNASQSGSTIQYQYDKIYTSVESIGATPAGSQVDYLSDLNLTAILSSAVDGVRGLALVVPKLERTNTPSLSIAGDKAVITIDYKCITPAGARKPFTLYRLNGATAA